MSSWKKYGDLSLEETFKHSQKEIYTHKYPGVDTHTQMYIMCPWIYICKFWFKFILVVTCFLGEKENNIWIFITERDTCSSCFSLCLDELSKRLKSKVIFDGRNIYPKRIEDEGFELFQIGC